MMHGLPVEVLLSSGYAIFLLAVAAILEKAATHSRRRTDQYELAGFRYHPGFDRWECPEGNHLLHIETDQERRVARYRAPAHFCNACTCKKDCTASETGREIEHQLDWWLRTGLSQFHRGVSLTLVVLASLLLLVQALRFREAHSAMLLGGLFVLAVFSGVKLVPPLRHTAPDSSTVGTPASLRG